MVCDSAAIDEIRLDTHRTLFQFFLYALSHDFSLFLTGSIRTKLIGHTEGASRLKNRA